MSKHGIDYVSKILDDIQYPEHFGKDVVQYADEIKADLIMIMTQKETGVQDYLRIGSFARHIIHESKNIPVMAIKPRGNNDVLGNRIVRLIDYYFCLVDKLKYNSVGHIFTFRFA